jgi:hypothetical protein
MAGKTEVVVLNHDFEEATSQDGSPAAANPELASKPVITGGSAEGTGSASPCSRHLWTRLHRQRMAATALTRKRRTSPTVTHERIMQCVKRYGGA